MPISEKRSLYIAYGSNLNLRQMAHRCPTAEVVGTTVLENYRLRFCGGSHCAVATIEKEQGSSVPVLIWSITEQDEKALDIYEGWPHLYRKELLPISVNGEQQTAMVYIMVEHSSHYKYNMPSGMYLNTIVEGYESAGFDLTILTQAVKESIKESVSNDTESI